MSKGTGIVELIKRLSRSANVKTFVDLAEYLEISPQAITHAMTRRQIPDAWLYKVAYRERRNIEWLRTGEGPEFLDEAAAEAAAEFGRTAVAREVFEALESMDPEEQAATRRFLDLMKRGDRKVIKHLIGQVELLDELASAKRRKKPPPDDAQQGGGVVG